MPENFLRTTLPLCERLTPAVVSIIKSILEVNRIEYLSINGRVKKFETAINKIRTKKYKNLEENFTDLSGIRVILFSESDVSKTCKLIEETFSVDRENSLDQTEKLGIDKSGYRSVHYVCKIGENRGNLPEFHNLLNLKFEIQVRTVLQHAWAELSHDRNYKFGFKLPLELERRLHLYAALLELADKGFDELSKSIDEYAHGLKTEGKLLSAELNSLSLVEFIKKWSEETNTKIDIEEGEPLDDLLGELNHFGVNSIEKLANIIPKNFSETFNKNKNETNIFGLIREWMLIKDWKKLKNYSQRKWIIISNDYEEFPVLQEHLGDEKFWEMINEFEDEFRN